MGTESAVYLELMERQRTERKPKSRASAMPNQNSWLQVMDDNISPEGIQRNLERLEHRDSGSRTAASWLVIAGKQILPLAHPKLTDPESSAEMKFALLQVVGEIGDPSSIPPVDRDHPPQLRNPGAAQGRVPGARRDAAFRGSPRTRG